MKWLAEKPSFVRYHLCVTMRKHRAWVCRATSAMRFWAISCWASAQNGSTSEVRHLVCTGNFFFIDHCSMFNAVPVSDLLPPSCALCKKTPNKHTHTPRTVSRRWKQLGATRPGPLNSQGQRWAHPVLSWHIGLTFVVLHNWLGYATRLALKKNVYVLNISYLVSLSNLLFAVFFFCSNKELWNIYYLSSTSGCKIRWTLRQPLWEYCVWTRASEALWFIRYLASTGAPVLPRHSWSQIFIIHL